MSVYDADITHITQRGRTFIAPLNIKPHTLALSPLRQSLHRYNLLAATSVADVATSSSSCHHAKLISAALLIRRGLAGYWLVSPWLCIARAACSAALKCIGIYSSYHYPCRSINTAFVVARLDSQSRFRPCAPIGFGCVGLFVWCDNAHVTQQQFIF